MSSTQPDAIPFPIETATRFRNPERVAWGVLLIAFAVFCLTCVLSLVAIHGFFFLSTVPMLSSVYAARGAISLTESDLSERTVRDSREVLIGNIVRPNPQSQALMVFSDPYDPSRILASITLDEAISAAGLRLATRPRYEWGNIGYQINLTNVQGDLEILVADGFGREFTLYLQTTQGSEIRIAGSGQYQVRALEDSIRVVNLRGEVVLLNPDLPWGQSAKGIPPGYQGLIYPDSAEIVVVEDGIVDLLTNTRFEQTVGAGFPEVWRCSETSDSTPPRGNLYTGLENGRQALFIIRGDSADSHGATYCEQGARQEETANWLSVLDYDYLALKASFYVNYQSLNRCGIDGSECPLMLRLDYVDRDGAPGTLFYGFYAVNTPVEKDYPLRCASCYQEHILIREKTWYTFNTGNLMELLTDAQRPHYITRVTFYASGHQYDTRVSEISLMAGNLEQIAPSFEARG